MDAAAEMLASLDMARMFEVFATKGKLEELFSIVLSVTPEEAGEVDVEEWLATFIPFGIKTMLPITALHSFGRRIG